MASNTYTQRLLLSQSFALNKSYTKQVSVGLKVQNNNFTPVIQLYGIQPYKAIEFLQQEWEIFLRRLNDILEQLAEAGIPKNTNPLFCGDVDIQITMTKNFKCVTLKQRANGHELHMRDTTLRELKLKGSWISQWLQYLDQVPVTDYTTTIGDRIAYLVEKNLTRQPGDQPSGQEIINYVKLNFENVYECCEKSLTYSGNCRNTQLFCMFFGEMITFHFNAIHKLILESFANAKLKFDTPYYGIDTVY